MSLWEVLHTFVEGMASKMVVWYRKDFESIRDGADGKHTGHPELDTHFHVIKRAIETPNEVRQDKNYPDRKCYYAWFTGDNVYKNMHMKAVLGRTFWGKLTVVTAYFTAGLSPQEQTIWTK